MRLFDNVREDAVSIRVRDSEAAASKRDQCKNLVEAAIGLQNLQCQKNKSTRKLFELKING